MHDSTPDAGDATASAVAQRAAKAGSSGATQTAMSAPRPGCSAARSDPADDERRHCDAKSHQEKDQEKERELLDRSGSPRILEVAHRLVGLEGLVVHGSPQRLEGLEGLDGLARRDCVRLDLGELPSGLLDDRWGRLRDVSGALELQAHPGGLLLAFGEEP